MIPSRKDGNQAARLKFERSFVAMSYLLGRRGEELTKPLLHSGAAAESLQSALNAPLREERARILAAELSRIVAALEARRIR
jgi:hypothetical protein